MKTNAIYTIHEKGTDFYFYTEHAGGFGYPFAAADFLHSLKYAIKSSMVSQKNICVSPLLEQMEGDYHFPDELENKRIFTKAEKEHLLKLATRQKIPMAIEIDMDADTVSFHFREDEEELQDLCDVTFSRYISREQKYDGSYCRQVLDNLMVRICLMNVTGIFGNSRKRHTDMSFKRHQRNLWSSRIRACSK